MDRERKLELLQQQISEAQDGRPVDFNTWRQKTGVVLRNVLGDAHPLYADFQQVRYSLSAWSTSTPTSAFDKAKVAGVRQAVAILARGG